MLDTAAHKSFNKPQFAQFLVVMASERITSRVTTATIQAVSLIVSLIKVMFVVVLLAKFRFVSPFVEME